MDFVITNISTKLSNLTAQQSLLFLLPFKQQKLIPLPKEQHSRFAWKEESPAKAIPTSGWQKPWAEQSWWYQDRVVFMELNTPCLQAEVWCWGMLLLFFWAKASALVRDVWQHWDSCFCAQINTVKPTLPVGSGPVFWEPFLPPAEQEIAMPSSHLWMQCCGWVPTFPRNPEASVGARLALLQWGWDGVGWGFREAGAEPAWAKLLHTELASTEPQRQCMCRAAGLGSDLSTPSLHPAIKLQTWAQQQPQLYLFLWAGTGWLFHLRQFRNSESEKI